MIDLKKLSTKEILQLQKDVDAAVRKIEPQEPDFYLRPHIQMEAKEYVNTELVPILELKISLSKEVLHTYRILWEKYYKEQDELHRYYYQLTPEKRVTLDARKEIEYAFIDLMDKNFRIEND